MASETYVPNPEYLIKSIAEQGYTLESSIADLIDNSISADAKRVEVLIDTQRTPFQLFIADDGNGMSLKELKKNIQFPSSSPEKSRNPEDLGRFGLGLKTASFAQTRCFTVISKTPKDKSYNARTWDVNHLKKGKWEVIVNSKAEIKQFLDNYYALSKGFLSPFKNHTPNTIIVWNGLYKFEAMGDRSDQSLIIQKELTETTKEHLQLIFHRFMEKKDGLQIRLNNEHLTPFNPFPSKARKISNKQKTLLGDKLNLEGYVLPNNAISESKGVSNWTLTHKSLTDMEGLYIYRADRLIAFGGWNGLIKKTPRLQLARLKVEIGNGIDHLFHLNVAKSSIIIPFSEKFAFIRYVSELKTEAEKEFFNVETRGQTLKKETKTIFKKLPTNQGMSLIIDDAFPLIRSLVDSLDDPQRKQLNIIFRMITTSVNRIKKVHTDDNYITLVEKAQINENDLAAAIKLLLESGVDTKSVKEHFIPDMGIDITSLPSSILTLLQ